MWVPFVLLIASAVALVGNDFASGAINASDSTTNFGTNVNALLWSQTYYISSSDVFYKYTAKTTGTAALNILSDNYITAVVFYGDLPNSLSPNSDEYLDYKTGCSASLSWTIAAGSTYYFAIGSYYSSISYQAPFNFTLTATTRSLLPGDLCTLPIPIPTALGISTGVATTGATTQDPFFSNGVGDIFWSWQANCTGTANATITGGTESTLVTPYFINSCDAIISTKNQYGTGGPAYTTVSWPVNNGVTYIVAGAYYYACTVPLDISITCMPLASGTRPANDKCTTALAAAAGVPWSTDNTNANTDYNPNRCSSYPAYQEVWVAYNATCTGNITLSLSASSRVEVFKGTCANNYPVYCGSSCDSHTFSVFNGDMLWFALGDDQGSAAQSLIGNITCAAAVGSVPSNTQCANKKVVVDGMNTDNTINAMADPHTLYAMTDLYSNSDCNSMKNTLFYWYNASCTGDVTINVVADGYSDPIFALYEDVNCGQNFPPVYCDQSGSSNTITFNTLQSQTYTFAFGTDLWSALQFNISCNGVSSMAPTAPTAASTGVPTAPTATSTHVPTAPTSASSSVPSKTPTAPTSTSSSVPSKTPTTSNTSGANSSTAPTPATKTSAAEIAAFGLATFLSVVLL